MTLLDWVWIVLAWSVVVGGAALLLWSLLWDRARGRKRCPRCWYDLSAQAKHLARDLPIRCPECGREVRRARRLTKTHRRWRWAILGLILIISGFGASFGRHVYRDGLIKATPTWAYILAMPWLDETGAYRELHWRVVSGDLAHWEYTLLVRRSVRVLQTSDDTPSLIRSMRLLGAVEWGGVIASEHRPWKNWDLASDIDREGVIQGFDRAMTHADEAVRFFATKSAFDLGPLMMRYALVLLGSMERPATVASGDLRIPVAFLIWHDNGSAPTVPTMFDSRPWSEELWSLIDEISAFGLDTQAAVPVLLDHLSSEDRNVREFCVWMLAVLGSDDPAVREAVMARFDDEDDDEDKDVRARVVSCIAVFPFTDNERAVLERAISDESPSVEWAAIEASIALGADGAPYRRRLIESRSPESLFLNRPEILIRLGWDRDQAIALAFGRAAKDSITNDGIRMVKLLLFERDEGVQGNDELPETLRAEIRQWASQFRNDSDPTIQAIATLVYVAYGGDVLPVIYALADASLYGGDANKLVSRIIDPDVAATLMDSNDPIERRVGARLAGPMRTRAAPLLPRLRELRHDSDQSVVSHAHNSIEEIEGWIRYERKQRR